MNQIKRGLWGMVLILGSFAAYASDNPQDCALIEDEQERVTCYDNLFRTGLKQGTSGPQQETLSLIKSRKEQEEAQQRQWFSITAHRPNYVIPFGYNTTPDYSAYGQSGELFNDVEAKFQFSLKTQVWPRMWRNSSLWAAYTQQLYWQVYADEKASSPFRETNHEPELIWDLPVKFRFLGLNARLISVAFNHQSNGRAEPLSRSWNRLIGQIVLEKGRFVVSVKPWVRVDGFSSDDNPGIEEFMGRIALGAAFKVNRNTFAIRIKNNLRRDNRSGLEFHWTFPFMQHLKGYTQVYSGYGENLIDMKNYNNRIGLGIILTDWL